MKPRRIVEEHLVFVLGPLNSEWKEGIFELSIRPTIADLGMRAEHALLSHRSREAMKNVWDNIWRAKLVIADVTTDKLNVNYELGICHCLGVPVILIANVSRKEEMPFDWGHLHVHRFDSPANLQSQLKAAIEALGSEESAEEPIWKWPGTWYPQRDSLWRKDNDDAHLDLGLRIVRRKDTFKKAILVQYSCLMVDQTLRKLWKSTNADIELYMVGKNNVLNPRQTDRRNEFLRKLEHQLRVYVEDSTTQGTLKVFQYDAPGSLRCILLQDEMLSIGTYLYEWRQTEEDYPAGLDVRGGEKPTLVFDRCDPEFEPAQAMVLNLIKNWQQEKVATLVAEFSRDGKTWEWHRGEQAQAATS